MKIGLRYRAELAGLSWHLLADLEALVAALQVFARPSTALTAASAAAINSGDATTDAVIANLRTRVGELEVLLQSKGLLS